MTQLHLEKHNVKPWKFKLKFNLKLIAVFNLPFRQYANKTLLLFSFIRIYYYFYNGQHFIALLLYLR